MKVLYFVLFIIFWLNIQVLNAQFSKVSGIVTDSIGNPIEGASVFEKGMQTNGVQTNLKGRFEINLKGLSHTLVISFTGYTTQNINLGNKSNVIKVILNSNVADLTEVVIVGYGQQKKITSTGAIGTISGSELRENASASIQNVMSGKISGFFSQQGSGKPGSDGATFNIRGVSSYNSGSTSPTIYVDDIEYSYDQFSRIDPNEVESITVLKDASATAVFGVRGANGVVIVTTRRGKINAPQISFRSETGIQQPGIFPKFLNAYDAAVLYNRGCVTDGQPSYFSDADLSAYKNHTDPYGHPDIDWKNMLFKKFSYQYRANLDISGGTERVKYFVSGGYVYQDGMIKDFGSKVGVNNNYYNKRYNYRSNMDIKVTGSTDLRIDFSGTSGIINTPQVGSPNGNNDVFYDYSSLWTLAPWAYPIYNPNGSLGYSSWAKNPGAGGTSYDVNNIIGRLTYLGYNRTFENNMYSLATVNQKLSFITSGLSLKGTFSYSSYYSNATISMTGGDFPSFIYDPTAQTYSPRSSNIFEVSPLIRKSNNGSTIRNVSSQVGLNYDRTFFNRHHIYGVLLFLKQSDTRANGSITYNFIPSKFISYVARVGYDYRKKYLIEFNSAYNGSDRFSIENRFGFFPAVSGGWNISEEPFFKKNIKLINRLKFRGSYGLVGNDKLGAFTYYYQQSYTFASNMVFFGSPFGNAGTAIFEGALGNSKVTWEKEKKLDLGVEFEFLENKLTATFDYFNNNRYDILTDRSGQTDSRFGSMPLLFGQALPPVNLGKVKNKGFEMDISYRNKIGKNISFSIKTTFSTAKNEILFADEPSYKYSYQNYTGHSINTQRVYTWIGFYKDASDIASSAKPLGLVVRPGDLKYADLNGDGIIDGSDAKVQGNPNVPNSTAGLNLNVKYKNFSIGVFFQGSWNFNVRGFGEAIQPFSANFQAVHQKAWTPELGDNAKFPLLSFIPGISDSRAYPSTFWLTPGDYVRLKTAELGYYLPKSWLRRIRMQEVRVYANGYNLITWTKLNKLYQIDPEINQGVNGSGGTDRVVYPPQRIFNFGVSTKF